MIWLLSIYALVSTWILCRYFWEKSDGVNNVFTDKYLANAALITLLWPLLVYALVVIMPFALIQDFRDRRKK